VCGIILYVVLYAADAFGKLRSELHVYTLVDDLRSRVCILYARAVNTRAAEEKKETREG